MGNKLQKIENNDNLANDVINKSKLLSYDDIQNLKFYKFTNQNEFHHNYQYTDGLNVLHDVFDITSSTNGFHITTNDYIHNYKHYGNGIREIFLPLDNPNFKIVKINNSNVWKTNMVILGKKYFIDNNSDLLFIYKNINKYICNFNLENITISESQDLLNLNDDGLTHTYVNYFVDNENYDLLKLIIYNQNIINLCLVSSLMKNKIGVATWCKQYCDNINFVTEEKIIQLTKRGSIDSLEWLKNNGYNFKFNKYCVIEEIIKLYNSNSIAMLNWYADSGLNIKFSKIVVASLLIDLDTNDFFNDDDSCENQQIYSNSDSEISNQKSMIKKNIKEWFINRNCNIDYDCVFIDGLCYDK